VPVNQELYPYQKEGVEFIVQKRRVLLADAMGVGKTAQAISAMVRLGCNYLVVSPASLVANWQREIKMWSGRDAQVYTRGKAIRPHDPLILTYGQISADVKHLEIVMAGLEYFAIIFDEAHALKNPSSTRTMRALNQNLLLSKATEALIFITGTPIENRPIELYPLLKALGVVRESLHEFGARYSKPQMNFFSKKLEFVGAINHDELNRRLRSTCMIRRTKEEVLPFLPPKVRREITLSGKNPKDLLTREMDYYNRPQLTAAEVEDLAQVRVQLAIIKAPMVVEYVEMALESSEKVVVFGWHRQLLVELLCGLARYSPAVLSGATPAAQRQARVDRFQRDPGCRVFIGSITAAGVGLTLTAASHVVMAELSWKPGENEQCLDRCHRIGQKNSVLADYLCFPNSVDQRVLKVCREKQADIDLILK
jgi:SWI/SNF-related matrix-associated actin-dependent regulator 1 of chromatin subfamily A